MNTGEVIPTILLVEEDFIFALSLQVFLKGEFHIVHCNNFAEASAFLQRCQVDGFIVDINLRNTAEQAIDFLNKHLHIPDTGKIHTLTLLAPEMADMRSIMHQMPQAKGMSIPIDYELFRMLLIKQYFGDVQAQLFGQRA
jgi:response regulator RpfG family c-di-GMP phosphodiesterase